MSSTNEAASVAVYESRQHVTKTLNDRKYDSMRQITTRAARAMPPAVRGSKVRDALRGRVPILARTDRRIRFQGAGNA